MRSAQWDGQRYTLDLHHAEQDVGGRMTTESLVFATGYTSCVPEFLDPVRDRLSFDDQGRYAASSTFAVSDTGDVFVQNGEEHTHGFVAPDLGMGALRNSVILAGVLGREVYRVEKRIAFQEFGMPDRLRNESRTA